MAMVLMATAPAPLMSKNFNSHNAEVNAGKGTGHFRIQTDNTKQ
jgi:hypothetical protein